MKWLVGIDEAGRGPLAGPVAVGVFACLKNVQHSVLHRVKDSKKCSAKLREELFREIKSFCSDGRSLYAVGFASALYIDRYGIVPAIRHAMAQALKKVNLDPRDCEVMLDGSLKAPPEYKKQKTIIKGDVKIPVISAASICAKVMRDRKMVRISKKYPLYGFDIHKGYGTLAHRKTILKHGMSKEHRKTFLKNVLK